MLSIVSIAMLTGCSAASKTEKTNFAVTIEKETFAHPAKPKKPKISDETFVDCGVEGFVCVTKKDAKKIPANKLEASRTIKEQDAVIDYYRCFGSVPKSGRPSHCANLSSNN